MEENGPFNFSFHFLPLKLSKLLCYVIYKIDEFNKLDKLNFKLIASYKRRRIIPSIQGVRYNVQGVLKFCMIVFYRVV